MALEYNKYDHIHIRVPYLDYFDEKSIVKSKIVTYDEVSKYKRFKVKSTQFNVRIVFFFKAQIWKYQIHKFGELLHLKDPQLEIESLNKLIEFYEKFLKENFTFSLEENEKMLIDPSLGYHEYFATVYRLERQRIILK